MVGFGCSLMSTDGFIGYDAADGDGCVLTISDAVDNCRPD